MKISILQVSIGAALLAGLAPVHAQDAPTSDSPAIERQTILLDGSNIEFLEAGAGETVILLHGQRFNAETWRELGTLELLAEQGYRVLAIDLPGHGGSQASAMTPESFLATLLPLLSDRPAVVVSPSMSGRFSLPLLAHHSSLMSGFVALAPVEIPEYLDGVRGNDLPTLLIWGQNDRVVPLEHAHALGEALPRSRQVVIEGAGHPSYLDAPAEFHRELLAFLRSLG